mmetsp:Transcript_41311/g.86508  ORF Transcript_41311/g.86508 Transcript_41311/m.86508 type:complete len:228 (-) Transcript_41311:1026-1709(-)
MTRRTNMPRAALCSRAAAADSRERGSATAAPPPSATCALPSAATRAHGSVSASMRRATRPPSSASHLAVLRRQLPLSVLYARPWRSSSREWTTTRRRAATSSSATPQARVSSESSSATSDEMRSATLDAAGDDAASGVTGASVCSPPASCAAVPTSFGTTRSLPRPRISATASSSSSESKGTCDDETALSRLRRASGPSSRGASSDSSCAALEVSSERVKSAAALAW